MEDFSKNMTCKNGLWEFFLTWFSLISDQQEVKLNQQNHIQILLFSLKVYTEEGVYVFSHDCWLHIFFTKAQSDVNIFLSIFN